MNRAVRFACTLLFISACLFAQRDLGTITGTITDAWPVAPGETWTSDYGILGLSGLTLRFA